MYVMQAAALDARAALLKDLAPELAGKIIVDVVSRQLGACHKKPPALQLRLHASSLVHEIAISSSAAGSLHCLYHSSVPERSPQS